jgi:two-component system OmpR family sensor kinase
MNRAFFSLYGFIVLSVILIGWSLNEFWETLQPDADTTAEIRDIFTLVDAGLSEKSAADSRVYLQKINQQLQHNVRMFSPDELANTAIAEVIFSGEIVHAINENNAAVWYKKSDSQPHIMVITAPLQNPGYSFLYLGLLIVFYLSIALVVFLWLWPLTRDLARLESQTRKIGGEGKEQALGISARSTIYPLANAFNKMSGRIRELINSHKEMTYAVSHELRTPLARMKFSLAMLEANDNTNQPQLENLQQDIHEMEGLISSLLLYAGFEQTNGKLTLREGDMKSLIDQMLVRIERGPAKAIDIFVDDQSDGKPFVCEWKLMEIALQNLLQNALRFANRKITVTLKVSDNQQYSLTVEDDGPGIPPEERERVFESFVRLYADARNQKGGFGLGLAIVKRIIQWHQGKVSISESAAGGASISMSWQS